MTEYTYHTNAVVFAVPAGFVDRSITALEWNGQAGGRIGLTLQKEAFSGGSLEDVVRENAKKMSRALKGYKETSLEQVERQGGGQTVRLVFEFRSEATQLVQHQLYVAAGEDLLIFGVVGRPVDRAECERVIDGVCQSLEFREG